MICIVREEDVLLTLIVFLKLRMETLVNMYGMEWVIYLHYPIFFVLFFSICSSKLSYGR